MLCLQLHTSEIEFLDNMPVLEKDVFEEAAKKMSVVELRKSYYKSDQEKLLLINKFLVLTTYFFKNY